MDKIIVDHRDELINPGEVGVKTPLYPERSAIHESTAMAKSTSIFSAGSKAEREVEQPNRRVAKIEWTCVRNFQLHLIELERLNRAQRCGARFKEHVLELWPGLANQLVKDCTSDDREDHDLEKQAPCDQQSSTSSSSSAMDSSKSSKKAQNPDPSDSPDANPGTLRSTSREDSPGANELQKWVLLCLPGRICDEVEHANVKAVRCNKELYVALHACYQSGIRSWIRWMTLRRIDTIDFVRVGNPSPVPLLIAPLGRMSYMLTILISRAVPDLLPLLCEH